MGPCVRFSGELSDSFPVAVGVKNGCVLSPTLFNILLACILRVVYSRIDNDGRGIYITYQLDGNLFNLRRLQARTCTQQCRVLDLQYADDAVLVDHSADGLPMSLAALSSEYEERASRVWLIILSLLVNCSDEREQAVFTTNGRSLENSELFVYLCFEIFDHLDLGTEINMRIGRASSAFGRLRNGNILLKTKISG